MLSLVLFGNLFSHLSLPIGKGHLFYMNPMILELGSVITPGRRTNRELGLGKASMYLSVGN